MKIVATKIKSIKSDISKMKRVSELINYVPEQVIEKSAYILLMIWILSPILMMFRSIFMNYSDEFDQLYKHSYLDIIWFTLLQQIGYIGFLLGIVMFGKSILQAKEKKVSLRQYLSSNLFPLFLLFMLIWSVLSCLVSDNISLSLNGDTYRFDGLRTYFAYCGIFSCAYIVTNKYLMQHIISYFTHIAVFLSLLVLVNIENINNVFGLTANMAIFNNTNHFAYYLCLALMCAMLLFLIEKRSTIRLLLRIVELAIITSALVQNKSFGSYLAVIVGLICCVVLVIWLDKNALKRVLIALIIFILISLIMNISSGYISNDLHKLVTDTSNVFNGSKDAARAGSGRWRLWVKGLQFAAERPLFGYGPDNLGARYAEVGINMDRPHNEFIQFAASLGIPAVIFYISALIVHFVSFIQKRKQLSLTMIGILCAVVTYLVSSLFGNTMYYTTPFFFMILGLSAGTLKSVPEKIK